MSVLSCAVNIDTFAKTNIIKIYNVVQNCAPVPPPPHTLHLQEQCGSKHIWLEQWGFPQSARSKMSQHNETQSTALLLSSHLQRHMPEPPVQILDCKPQHEIFTTGTRRHESLKQFGDAAAAAKLNCIIFKATTDRNLKNILIRKVLDDVICVPVACFMLFLPPLCCRKSPDLLRHGLLWTPEGVLWSLAQRY